VLLRLRRWARPALPRIALGGLTALGASLLALAVPQVLRVIVNGPLLSEGSQRGVILGALVVLALGVLEAFLVWCRRAPGRRAHRGSRPAATPRTAADR